MLRVVSSARQEGKSGDDRETFSQLRRYKRIQRAMGPGPPRRWFDGKKGEVAPGIMNQTRPPGGKFFAANKLPRGPGGHAGVCGDIHPRTLYTNGCDPGRSMGHE